MKPAIRAACLLLALLLPRVVRAAESVGDRETDHFDAFDDGGPRSFGVLVNPAGLLLGAFGVEGDLLLGDAGAVSVDIDGAMAAGATALGATLGFPLFPQRVPFHGLVVIPRLSWAWATQGGATAEVLGGGATLGWEWTLRAGLTIRAGAGARIDGIVGGQAAAGAFFDGLRPLADGSVGWVF